MEHYVYIFKDGKIRVLHDLCLLCEYAVSNDMARQITLNLYDPFTGVEQAEHNLVTCTIFHYHEIEGLVYFPTINKNT